ncbi:MAG: DNA methyltransferase [Nitrospira sp.]|nr:DNA methyltransferase [Nitrospira sp.]
MGKNKKVDSYTKQLFTDPSGQDDMFDKSYEQELEEKQGRKVECLGMTFENDEERRKYFLEKLRDKLKYPEFRKIEGFPIGSDEDILALSDPPYYTACPNPFIEDFIKLYGKPYDPKTDNYRREPFAADVSEGKNDPIYNAHSYHTKVPHKAIMRYILHYTEPGDIVFDGFCGTGMTGVAAQLCGDKKTVESLFTINVSQDNRLDAKETTSIGKRNAILIDLSPSATFISHNYNKKHDLSKFKQDSRELLCKAERELGWMYKTLHKSGNNGRIDYVVHSDVYSCPECSEEILYWGAAIDAKTRMKRPDGIVCSSCKTNQSKSELKRVWESYYDKTTKKVRQRQKRLPVLFVYKYDGKSFEKEPDADDLKLLERIEQIEIPYWYPTNRLPMGDKTTEYSNFSIEEIHQLFSKRALFALSFLVSHARESIADSTILFCIQSIMMSFTPQNRFFEASYSQVNRYLKGTVYISPLIAEVSPWYALSGKLKRFTQVAPSLGTNMVSTSSVTQSLIPSNSIDYIFTDPPFGSNLMYSELNLVWESWLKVLTNKRPEAIENRTQGKMLNDYKALMSTAFKEYHRVLKPGRWMTVEFHNSRNSVWIAIQEAIQQADFVIADVRTIDKQQNTMNQMTAAGAVKQDLIISAYKPNGGLEERFKLEAGTIEGVWDFVRTHLKQLPVFVSKDGQAEIIAERQNYLLFDRMVAFHVQRGVTIPLSASEFYAGLVQRFPARDGMYFLPDQVAEYDRRRMTVKEILQLQLFVNDEASAIQWLKQQLTRKPQTFQEIHPQFMRELGGWQKHEKPLELMELLGQNFITYDGKGPIPPQLVSWMKQSEEMRKQIQEELASGRSSEENGLLITHHSSLITRVKDRWHVPDPNKASDLEKLRERSLLKEFEEYRKSSQKRLKIFRLEAVRAGFKKAWQERDYQTIITVANKIPDNILQEDPKLLMWYDQAITRMGDE